jgi:hypothetical protein
MSGKLPISRRVILPPPAEPKPVVPVVSGSLAARKLAVAAKKLAAAASVSNITEELGNLELSAPTSPRVAPKTPAIKKLGSIVPKETSIPASKRAAMLSALRKTTTVPQPEEEEEEEDDLSLEEDEEEEPEPVAPISAVRRTTMLAALSRSKAPQPPAITLEKPAVPVPATKRATMLAALSKSKVPVPKEPEPEEEPEEEPIVPIRPSKRAVMLSALTKLKQSPVPPVGPTLAPPADLTTMASSTRMIEPAKAEEEEPAPTKRGAALLAAVKAIPRKLPEAYVPVVERSDNDEPIVTATRKATNKSSITNITARKTYSTPAVSSEPLLDRVIKAINTHSGLQESSTPSPSVNIASPTRVMAPAKKSSPRVNAGISTSLILRNITPEQRSRAWELIEGNQLDRNALTTIITEKRKKISGYNLIQMKEKLGFIYNEPPRDQVGTMEHLAKMLQAIYDDAKMNPQN